MHTSVSASGCPAERQKSETALQEAHADKPADVECSVVIPVYNSGSVLTALVSELTRVLPTVAVRYEVIFVNDGSSDNSCEVMSHLCRTHPWVRGINLLRNYGQHNAILCGVRTARCGVIVTMDDDLRHPPEEIPRLLDKLTDGVDVVYGTPEAEQHGFWRDIASQVTKLALQTTMGVENARNVSAFRVFRTQLRDAFADYRCSFVSMDVLLTFGNTHFASVAVRYKPRQHGTSNYTFRKLLTHAINMITGFSTLPLHAATLMGFFLTLFGIAVLAYVVIRWLVQGNVVPGFPFLASLISIFSGAQLFSLGIIGEYLARVHFRMMERPSYAVESEIGQGKLG